MINCSNFIHHIIDQVIFPHHFYCQMPRPRWPLISSPANLQFIRHHAATSALERNYGKTRFCLFSASRPQCDRGPAAQTYKVGRTILQGRKTSRIDAASQEGILDLTIGESFYIGQGVQEYRRILAGEQQLNDKHIG